MRAKRTAQSIVAKLIPRDAYTYSEERSVRGKLDCYDVASQSDLGVTYHASYRVHSRTYWCSCPGHEGHGYCKHSDSLAYYRHVDEARHCYRQWDDDRLATEQGQLLGVHADLGLDWPGLAELDALGEEIAARLDATTTAA